ncbi:MAG: PucC family protein [Rhodobacteraceae bacterium]|nr:PucC family protein [Paracoccaceae bacterium]
MQTLRLAMLRRHSQLAPTYLPFADVATDDVPLSRLLRLSLFQVTVGMALVLLVGTLNRVRIIELSVPATLVAGMLALPLLFAPFQDAWKSLLDRSALKTLMIVMALGTFGFSMADVLLDPYGAVALGLSVADTTKLTALLAGGTLVGFGIASRTLGTAGEPSHLAILGALIVIPGFLAIIGASYIFGAILFVAGTAITGLGAGLFGHVTLTATLRRTPEGQVGLSIGTWGAVQATCAGISVAMAGVIRDILVRGVDFSGNPASGPCNFVFMLEIAFLVLAIGMAIQLGKRGRSSSAQSASAQQTNPVQVT